MLADEILAHDDSVHTEMLGPLGWKDAIRRAVRFDMSREVVLSARVLQAQPLESRLKALSVARAPFKTTWFEWPGNPRERLRDGVRSTDDFRSEVVAPTPRRMGALIEVDESHQRGVVSFAWVHGDSYVNYCPLAWMFDFTPDPEPVQDLNRAEVLAMLEDAKKSGKIEGRYSNSNIEAIVDYARRMGIVASPLSPDVLNPRRWSGRFPREFIHQAMLDITGEDDALISLLLVLNSRNIVNVVDRPAPPKLNKARAKRGKPPLLDFHEVQIKLSRALAARAGEGGVRDQSRAHIVRGHFKVRAPSKAGKGGGVFWWSPHLRGDATKGVLPATNYAVKK